MKLTLSDPASGPDERADKFTLYLCGYRIGVDSLGGQKLAGVVYFINPSWLDCDLFEASGGQL